MGAQPFSVATARWPAPLVSLNVFSTTHRVPCWSPDRSGIAYLSEQQGQSPALVVADGTGQNPRTLAQVRPSVAFSWSPAGDMFVLGDDQDASIGMFLGLRLMKLNGADITITRERVFAFFMVSKIIRGEERTIQNKTPHQWRGVL